MTTNPRLGSICVADYAEYGEGCAGFVVERFGYGNSAEPHWAIPAWDEWNASELEGPFSSRAEAEEAILLHRQLAA